MTRGSQTGTSGVNPLMSLKRIVTSENTNTTQARNEPKNVSRIMAFARKMDGVDKKISQCRNWPYNNMKWLAGGEILLYDYTPTYGRNRANSNNIHPFGQGIHFNF